MKKYYVILFIFALLAANSDIFAQNRTVARGAEPGELYISNFWFGIFNPNWGPPFYDTARVALYRLTENGKKLTIQYETCYFTTNPETNMNPDFILADATLGVVYNNFVYQKNSYTHSQLWFSDDWGKNWMMREENEGDQVYFSSNCEGLIYKSRRNGPWTSAFKSENYGISFTETNSSYIFGEHGFEDEEFYFVTGSNPCQY